MQYAGVRGSLGYWGTPSGSEVDFVWWRGSEMVAIEAKASRRYRREFGAGVNALLADREARSYIVYRGEVELDVEGTRVLPLEAFLRRLHAGEIIG
jgi:predicted AAA+ superfamily ATPase